MKGDNAGEEARRRSLTDDEAAQATGGADDNLPEPWKCPYCEKVEYTYAGKESHRCPRKPIIIRPLHNLSLDKE